MAGGAVGGHFRDQSEVYDGSSWVKVGNLPWQLCRFTIINIDNKILLFGKHERKIYLKLSNNNMLYVCSGGTGFRSFQSNNILEFDINKREWTIVGKLTHATQDMGVSEVDFADFEPWCQNDTLAS